MSDAIQLQSAFLSLSPSLSRGNGWDAHVPSPRDVTQECHPDIFTLLLFRSSANSYRVTDTWDCKVEVASKNQDQGKKKKNPQRQLNQIQYKYNVLELFNHTAFFNKEVVRILQYFLLA